MKTSQSKYSVESTNREITNIKISNKLEKPRKIWHKDYYITLNKYFGIKYVIFMIDTYFFLKGATAETIYAVLLPLSQVLKLDSIQYQRLQQTSHLAWAVKGIFGVISDSFPLFGFHKLSYITITLIVSTLSCLLLALLPEDTITKYIFILFICVFFGGLACSVCDLSCEGKYTAIMMAHPETGGDVISLVMFFTFTGRILVASYLGTVVASKGVYPILWTTVAYLGHALILCGLNFFDERRVEKTLRNKVDWKKLKKMKSYAILAVVSCVGPIIISVYQPKSTFANLGMVFGVYATAMVTSYCLLPRKLSHTNFYNFLDGLTPSYTGAVEYWYTGDAICIPGGPHFSMAYYRTVSSLGSVIAQIFGVLIFQNYLSTMKYKTLNFSTNLLIGASQLFDVIILLRWNIKYFNISDKMFFFLGDAILQPVFGTLRFLVGFIILSRLCPESMECTAFAILAGFSNFSAVASFALGNVVLERFDVHLGTDYCSYDYLPMIKFVTAVVSSILLAFLQNLVLPNKKMSDVFTEDEILADDFSIDIYLNWLGKKLKRVAKFFNRSKKSQQMITKN